MHRPNEMSGGEQQRVTIARALVGRPAIVWADEPTGNLDSAMAESVMALLRQLNEEEQQTIVLVTHDAGIGGSAGRVLRMRDGRLVADEHHAPAMAAHAAAG
jgi:putative ABC transport system ATP-binding protein